MRTGWPRRQQIEKEQGSHGVENIVCEEGVIPDSRQDHQGEVTKNDLDELLDELLQSDAEQRAVGEYDMQDRVHLEAEQREEEEWVARKQAVALAQLQTEAANVPLPPETEVAGIGQPVTQLLFQNLTTQSRERGNPVNNDQPMSSRDTRQETAGKQRQRRPAGIQKSRMRKALQTRQATNREDGRVAAIYDQLGWELQDPDAAGTEGPSSLARQAAGADLGINTVETRTAPVQEAAPGSSSVQPAVATPASEHNGVPANMDPPVSSSGPRADAEWNTVQRQPEAAVATSLVPVTSTDGGPSGTMNPENPHSRSVVVREGGKVGKGTPKLIRKTRKNKATLRDANRAGTREAAIDTALEDESTVIPSPALTIERRVAMPSVSPTPATTEGPAERRRVRFDSTPSDIDPPTSREHPPRPATQYDFRGLGRGTLTDPGGNSSNVAADQPAAWTLTLTGDEPQQAPSDGSIAITFYIYERDQWKVAHVSTVDPSEPSSLEQMVWRYKKQNMFVYNMKMQTVSVASSFLAATADGANALLLIPREIKEQMDGKQPIPPAPVGREQSKRTRR